MLVVCGQCGKEFHAPRCYVERGRAKHCSKDCQSKSKVRPLADRFWEKVNKTEECWIWKGATRGGYGIICSFGHNGRPMLTHRVSWEIHYGVIPDGLRVLHSCDNPPCCRPDHLFLGTQADNVADMLKKGREKLKGNQKLTDEQVIEIRTRYQAGDHRRTLLALEYGTSPSNLSSILSGASREAGKEMLRDKKPIGWAHRGDRSAMAKLTWEQVRDIRARYTGARGECG